jgi:hypothetical protein
MGGITMSLCPEDITINGDESEQHAQVEKLLHSKYDVEPGRRKITLRYTGNLGHQVISAVVEPFVLQAVIPGGLLPMPGSDVDIKETVEAVDIAPEGVRFFCERYGKKLKVSKREHVSGEETLKRVKAVAKRREKLMAAIRTGPH